MRETPSSVVRQRSAAVGGLAYCQRALVIAVALFALIVGVLVPTGPAEAANPSEGFDAGNIIADANFYNGNAMTTQEVQSFLSRQVPECWLGRPGYEVGKPVQWGGPTKLAAKCLRDFRVSTATQAANAHCAGMPGVNNETAASIITRVGQACGISQKVLLVMLDKEQSLVSDPWPNENQFFLAMGYACPDSGPGNSASCDPALGGFAKQVYRAAWQYKVYKAFPNSYRYKPFQVNTIQWHPNISCGTSQVMIENFATAGLYIYTPYRPNQAALNAGWGTGDGCSTYGNRNFFNLYKAWFGPPSIRVHERFTALYASLGTSLGTITGNAVDEAGGLRQNLEKGVMYWHSKVGPQVVKGGIGDFYRERGGASSDLGFPVAKEAAITGGYYQEFQNGMIAYVNVRQRYVVKGSIRAYFQRIGSFAQAGFPVSGERKLADGTWIQDFAKGTVYWKGANGAFLRPGKIKDFVQAQGLGNLGSQVGAQIESAEGVSQEFSNATLYWSSVNGHLPVQGSIRKYQVAVGGVSVSGFPVSGERKLADGTWIQDFAKGTVYWKGANGAFLRPGKIKDFVQAQGLGNLGSQVGAQIESAEGVSQEFSNATLYWSSVNGHLPVQGSIRKYQVAVGGVSVSGFPVSGERKLADGTWIQDFAKGTVYWKGANGRFEAARAEGKLSTGDSTPQRSASEVPKEQVEPSGDED